MIRRATEADAAEVSRVFVEGEIDYRSYEDRDGVTRWTTEIRASEVLPAGVLSGGESKPAGAKPAAARSRGRRVTAVQTSAL